ncbi:MAG: hypothetical protein CVT64_02115 [Actinobacteria bacterium HGW-Actinobacteria-4]|nr:MAG: hypothetical protein CVT64_02115 [Actinobacteria bacterium HGW-Actinobacteria-4]
MAALAIPAAAIGNPEAAGVVPTAEPDAPSLTGTVTSFGPAVVSPGGSISTTVEIASSSVENSDGLALRMTMTQLPLTSRDDVAAFLDAPEEFASRTVVERPLPAVSLGQPARANLAAPVAGLALPPETWGVYGLAVVLTGAGESRVIDTMVFTWTDAPIPSLPVAVVATASGTDARVGALLTAAEHPSVTLLVDPVAVGRLSGVAGSLSAREAYRVPASNPDLASLAHGPGASILEFALAQSASEVPRSLQGLPWVGIVPVLDEPTLQLAHDYGAVANLVEPRYGAVLSAMTTPGPGLPPPVANVTLEASGNTIALMMPEPGLSDLLAQYRPHHPAAPSRIVAESALIAAQGDGTQPIILSTGSSWMVDGTQPSPVLAALFDAPWVAPVSLASVLSDTRRGTATVSGVQTTEADLSASAVDAIATRLTRLQHLGATTESPATVVDGPSAALLGVVSLDARASQADRNGAVLDLLEVVDRTLESVSITSGSALNLVSATGNVPVTIRNDLDVASTVTVRMTANSPNIRITDSPVVTIPPHSEVTALIPVTAVSSANVTVRLSLRNENNDLIGTVRAVDMRVRADWGNAATAVFTVALVLLLIAGLVRTVRRGRKDTRTGPGEVAALDEPQSSGVAHD